MNILIIENSKEVQFLKKNRDTYVNFKIVTFIPNLYRELYLYKFDVISTSEFFNNQDHKEITKYSQIIYREVEKYIKNKSLYKTLSAETTFLFYLKVILNHILMLTIIVENIKKKYPLAQIKSLNLSNTKAIDIKIEPILKSNDSFIPYIIENLKVDELKFINNKKHFLDKIINKLNSKIVEKIINKKVLMVGAFNTNITLYLKYLLDKSNNRFEVIKFRIANQNIYKELIYSLYSFVKSTFKSKINYHNLNMFPLITIKPSFNKNNIEIITKDIISSNNFFYKNIDLRNAIFKKIAHIVGYSYFIDNSIKTTDNYLNKFADIKLISLSSLDYMAILGESAKRNKIESILISHGSHILSNCEYTNFEHEMLSIGQIDSKVYDNIVIQTPYSYDFMKGKGKNIVAKSKPIMWGNTFNKVNYKNKKIDKFIILHASTAKDLIRPIFYETPFEYIDNILAIYNIIKKYNDIELLVRFRPSKSISLETLKFFLPKSEKLKIVVDKTFEYYLQLSNVLVSYSSTTIEEAMLSNKPIILFGNKDLYSHIPDAPTFDTNKSNSKILYARDINEFEKSLNYMKRGEFSPENRYKTYSNKKIYEIL